MKKIAFLSAFVFAVAIVASSVQAATVEYRFLVNDVLASSHNMTPGGTYTLKVEGRVTDNIVTGTTKGGFIQASFNLSDSDNRVIFKEGVGFLGAGNGLWDSTAPAAFGSHNAGTLTDGATNVFQETGAVLPANWNTQFDAVGADVWSTVATGDFTYTGGLGSSTTLNVASLVAQNSIATLNGASIGGKAPDATVGYSSTLTAIPEPASLALFGLGAVGMMVVRRRRA